MGVDRRRGVVPVARLFDGGLAGLERDLGPLHPPCDRRIANPGVVGGGRMGVGERDVPILIDGKAREISVLTGAPVVDDPLLHQRRRAVETAELIPLHAGHRRPRLGAADRVGRPHGVVGPVRREVPRVVRGDAQRARLRAVGNTGWEGPRLECARRLRIGRDRNPTPPGEGVTAEGIRPPPERDDRAGGRRVGSGHKIHACDAHGPGGSQGIRRRTGLRIVSDGDDSAGGGAPHVHITRLEGVGASVLEDRISEHVEREEVARHVNLAIGAGDSSGEVEQGIGRGLDVEGVDEPGPGGIASRGDRDAET